MGAHDHQRHPTPELRTAFYSPEARGPGSVHNCAGARELGQPAKYCGFREVMELTPNRPDELGMIAPTGNRSFCFLIQAWELPTLSLHSGAADSGYLRGWPPWWKIWSFPRLAFDRIPCAGSDISWRWAGFKPDAWMHGHGAIFRRRPRSGPLDSLEEMQPDDVLVRPTAQRCSEDTRPPRPETLIKRF